MHILTTEEWNHVILSLSLENFRKLSLENFREKINTDIKTMQAKKCCWEPGIFNCVSATGKQATSWLPTNSAQRDKLGILPCTLPTTNLAAGSAAASPASTATDSSPKAN